VRLTPHRISKSQDRNFILNLNAASGLLWLSEIIEEHSRTSKLVGVRATYVRVLLHCHISQCPDLCLPFGLKTIIVLHILLWLIDSLPLSHIAFSIICHFVYLTNFTPQWPLISLSSHSFVGSCVLVLIDHFIWFTYFSQRTHRARQSIRKFGSADWRPLAASEAQMLTFMDIATFFGVCVWLVPLFLFLSLSANDNALPVSQSMNLPIGDECPPNFLFLCPQTIPALPPCSRP
jgi:hypothetical protein